MGGRPSSNVAGNVLESERWAPQTDSRWFIAFKDIIEAVKKEEQDSISGFLSDGQLNVGCLGAHGPKISAYSDSQVNKFIIRASTSAILCELIYLSPIDIETELNSWCQSHPGWFDCNEFELSRPEEGEPAGAFFGVFKFSSGTYVVMRGTIGGLRGPDWTTNLNIEPATFLQQADFVHQGFLARAKSLPLDMISAGEDELILAGHSLGGAAVLLAAVEMMHTRDKNCPIDKFPTVFTFGQPSCFCTAWPDPLFLLKMFVRVRVHRFYFDDDVVPTLTGNGTRACPENLIRLADDTVQQSRGPMPRMEAPNIAIAAMDAWRHSMRRYRMAVMNAACLQQGSVPFGRPALCRKASKFRINIVDQLKNNTDARGEARHGRFLLKVVGEGENAAIMKASLCDIEDPPTEIDGIRLTTLSHARKRGSTKMNFQATFDVTDAKFTKTIVNLSISNGFHAMTKRFNIQLNNVAFIGKMSHGKSHLIRALKAYATQTNYPAEEPRFDLNRHGDSQAEEFTHKTYTFYEVAGVGNDADVHLEVVSEALLKFPPRVVVVVWKAGEAFDTLSRDFHDLVKKVLDGIGRLSNPDAVKVVVVLTKCDKIGNQRFKSCYEGNLVDLKAKFGLPEGTPAFKVNSADVDGHQANVVGIAELYDHVNVTLSAALPLQEAIEIATMWRWLYNGFAMAAAAVGF